MQVPSRITATRLVAIGVFALAARKKTGAIYRPIDTPDLASVIECPKDENTKAREFAEQVMKTGKQAERFEADLPTRSEAAERDVCAARKETVRKERAAQSLATAESDES